MDISNDLSWNTHVDMVLKKANSRLYALRLLKKAGLLPADIVDSFIRSRIDYASPVWSSLPKSLSDLLESVQKRALKIAYPALAYEEALETSKLQPLSICRDASVRNSLNPCGVMHHLITPSLKSWKLVLVFEHMIMTCGMIILIKLYYLLCLTVLKTV